MLENEFIFWSVCFFVLGACLGSFANVVVYRMPLGLSVVKPGSHCTTCKTPVKWYHNIPIFAWFILRGKCAKCGAKFSVRYACVELLMALLFLWAFRVNGLNVTLVEHLLFIFAAVTASVIDLDHMILPDKLTLSGIVIGLAGSLINPDRTFLDAVIGVIAGGGSLWLVAYLYWIFRKREGMGGGDVKLLGWIGAVLGAGSIVYVIMVSSVLGALIGGVLAFRSKEGFRHAIPFGPFIVAAALAYMLLDGKGVVRWYLSLHGIEV